jgi:hypothetical protein
MFDVTEAVRSSAEGTGDLTFNLYNTVLLTGGAINFASKEHATVAYRPLLVYTLDAPTGVTADGGPEAGNVTVAWSAYTGAAFYRVYRAGAADGSYTRVGDAVTNLLFKDTGLTAGQSYYYRVSAVTDDGESERSAVVSAMPSSSSTTQVVSGDAYVEGSGTTRQSGDTNYGTQNALTVKVQSERIGLSPRILSALQRCHRFGPRGASGAASRAEHGQRRQLQSVRLIVQFVRMAFEQLDRNHGDVQQVSARVSAADLAALTRTGQKPGDGASEGGQHGDGGGCDGDRA